MRERTGSHGTAEGTEVQTGGPDRKRTAANLRDGVPAGERGGRDLLRRGRSGEVVRRPLFYFYNQTSSPEGAVSMHQSGESTVFSVDLNRLPGFLQRLVVTVAAESGTMQALARGLLTLEGELDRAAYVFTGAGVSAGEGPDSLRGVPQGWDLALFRGRQRLQRGTLRTAGPLRRGGGQA